LSLEVTGGVSEISLRDLNLRRFQDDVPAAIEAWIGRLGADEMEDRSIAEQELMKRMPAVRTRVEQATRDGDAEVSARAKSLLAWYHGASGVLEISDRIRVLWRRK